ncbi:MAG: glycosyltransferase family 9 protein [Candidatus Omnitrophica bacterium]|nr:glycosyltransferase family 9 protein [Candidatus Omnitrophota bacterium]
MKKILIIKLGYSETLDSMLSLTTSLGDVLRTTVILHFFKGSHITWLVDKNARPLLENNKYIDRIWVYGPNIVGQLKKEKFNIIVNLEKLPEICLLSDSLRTKEYFGFKFNNLTNDIYNGCEGSKRLIELTQDLDKKRRNKDCWQKIMAEALGREWRGQDYVLGYKPKSVIKYDVGFNWTVGNKWRNKAWPRAYWERLEDLIKNEYSISWQQGLNSIYEYIDWINSCRLIVTADTLGLHLGLALKKRIVALFGPTSPYEIYFYDRGSFLLPEAPYKCIPCLTSHCDKEKQCLEYIVPEKVKERIEDEFKKNKIASKV